MRQKLQTTGITLNLVGVKSNRDAIGAQVKVSTAAGDQFATVTTSSSYQSSSDKRLHFGLGTAESIREIDIRWPSGIRQVLHDQKPDQIVTITEPLKISRRLSLRCETNRVRNKTFMRRRVTPLEPDAGSSGSQAGCECFPVADAARAMTAGKLSLAEKDLQSVLRTAPEDLSCRRSAGGRPAYSSKRESEAEELFCRAIQKKTRFRASARSPRLALCAERSHGGSHSPVARSRTHGPLPSRRL